MNFHWKYPSLAIYHVNSVILYGLESQLYIVGPDIRDFLIFAFFASKFTQPNIQYEESIAEFFVIRNFLNRKKGRKCQKVILTVFPNFSNFVTRE